MNVNFESTNVPNNTAIANVLIDAASSVSGFDIEGSSIVVNGLGEHLWAPLDKKFQKVHDSAQLFICLTV